MSEMFFHPLSEFWVKEDGEHILNSWATASMLVRVAATGTRKERNKTARQNAIELINLSDPMVDANLILSQAKKSREGLLRAISLIEDGFTRRAHKATGYTGVNQRC